MITTIILITCLTGILWAASKIVSGISGSGKRNSSLHSGKYTSKGFVNSNGVNGRYPYR